MEYRTHDHRSCFSCYGSVAWRSLPWFATLTALWILLNQ
jgi:hypothetical protein